MADIHIGTSGYHYKHWLGRYYPAGTKANEMLAHYIRDFDTVELNNTFYQLPNESTFDAWRRNTPADFLFAVKGSRFITHMIKLKDAQRGLTNFMPRAERLGDKLGPILWQFMATKRFDPDDFAAFLALLPRQQEGIALQHAVEPRHESFRDPAFVAMARAAGVAIVFGDGADYPLVPDVGGPVVYARLMRARAERPQGYEAAELDRWADSAKAWARGESPAGFPYVAEPAPMRPRDAYIFFISAAKERNPAAAMALIDRL
jgi:uncharacterized protein YecE (DUF72 family)